MVPLQEVEIVSILIFHTSRSFLSIKSAWMLEIYLAYLTNYKILILIAQFLIFGWLRYISQNNW